ncbi:MAG: hypothetical protein ACYTFT_10445, partial [Planctomycetota bacterium]
MARLDLFSPKAWTSLLRLIEGDASIDAACAWAFHHQPELTARFASLTALAGSALGPPLGRRGLERLLRAIVWRGLIAADRGALLASCLPAIHERFLPRFGPDQGSLKHDLEVLGEFLEQVRELRGWSADAREEDRAQAYSEALEALEERLVHLGPAAAQARDLLESRKAAGARILTIVQPQAGHGVLLPGTPLRVSVSLTERSADSDGSLEREGAAEEGWLEGAAREARSIVEGRGYRGSWHAQVTLEGRRAWRRVEGSRPALVGGSGGLALLAAFHLAVGHRNPLPPWIGLTGALVDGRVAPVAHVAEKREVAAAFGVRVLLVPEACAQELEDPDPDSPAAHVRVVPVPAALRGGDLLSFLEETVAVYAPSLLRYEDERLQFFLARAEGRAMTGGRADARAELRFLLRVTESPADEHASPVFRRNVRAVALAGVGRTLSHEARALEALAVFASAKELLDELARSRDLLALAAPTYLGIDNLRAVSLIDLLRFDEAEVLLRAGVAAKRAADVFCPRRLLGAALGTLGQVLTYRGALEGPAAFEEAESFLREAEGLSEPRHRARDRVYRATAVIRGGDPRGGWDMLLDVREGTRRRDDRAAWETRRYAALRAMEAVARLDLSEVGAALAEATDWVEHERLAAAWQRGVASRFRGVALARMGDPAGAEIAFEASRDLFAPSLVHALHPDHALRAATDLEHAVVLEHAG